MNQKKIFYLLSLITIFFVGHYYSQFNNKAANPETISINTGIPIEQYDDDILNLQLLLDEHDSQLISALDKLQITKQKLNLSLSKIQILENELIKINKIYKLNEVELKEANIRILKSKDNINIFTKMLADTELELELSKFELELAEDRLHSQ
ncbi:hypothetical protein [Candidatus Thioglobus sp. NP1]|uniref:hypothetical protein n=1 Tax=Candidatus Thioglobus sp. NP1 TaxID=2508687 RepID=UPI000DED78A4|nr:hypothetical protein [Candidatus Thioglobus sp. NP1]AXE62422.1 hypothetical protein CRN91_07125 [Candidatus Thioglobus sp. NP1]